MMYFCKSKSNIERRVFKMSEDQKIIEQERKGVVELLLKKNGLTRKQLVEELVGIWTASWVGTLTEEEKKQFPHLAF